MGRPPRFCIGLALCFAACGVAAAQPVIDATITGRLLQKRGDTVIPLLDCTVFARSIDTGPLAGEYPDSQGRFRLDFPPHSRVTVGTICPGYQIFEINGRRTLPPTHDCSAPGPCADVQLTLQPLAVIEGYVVDHNGMPLEQISIQLRPPGAPRERGRQAVSDDRGYFRFFHLTPGDYELEPIVRGRQYEGFISLRPVFGKPLRFRRPMLFPAAAAGPLLGHCASDGNPRRTRPARPRSTQKACALGP